ncbi:MAG: LysR family transcriptional regulator [Myxococcota bacterium]
MRNLETIELRELRVFECIARLRSVTRAASELSIPKSVASKLLTRLEQRLDVRLLERSSRRIELTEAGAVLLQRARSVLADIDVLATDVRELRDEVRGTLVVAAPYELGAHLSRHFFPKFLAAHPDVSVRLSLSYSFVDLLDTRFDLAFRVGRVHDDRLVARRVGMLRRALVAAPALLKRYRLRGPEDLAGTPVVLFGEDVLSTTWTLVNAKQEVSVGVRGRFAARSFPAVAGAAEAGVGVALVPELAAHSRLEEGVLVRVLPDWHPTHAPIFLVHRSGHQRIRRVAALLAFASQKDAPIPR